MKEAVKPDLPKLEAALEADGDGLGDDDGDAVSFSFLSHFEMSAFKPQAFASFMVSSWVIFRFFNMMGLPKTSQMQFLSSAVSDSIFFIGVQHVSGTLSSFLKYD